MWQKMLQVGSGGSGTNVTFDKIWENPSKTSAFSATTITSSSSGWVSGKSIADYDYFAIVSKSAYNGDNKPRTVTIVKKNGLAQGFSYTSDSADSLRRVTITDSSIAFTKTIYGTSTATTYNNYCLPLYVLGVKGIDSIEEYIE